MDIRIRTVALASLVGLMSIGTAHAQSLDSLKEKGSEMMSGGDSAGLLSSLSSGSFSPSSMTNLTGVLSYCQENGYLGDSADGVKDKVMEAAGISSEPTDVSDYQEGKEGVLQGDGESFDLSSLGDKAGEKACGMVADKATSFIGG
ncbi:DUF2501 domain-containing protein [Salinicola corii]|nr:DUF2501 domain-containing protein [Salinicola corii]